MQFTRILAATDTRYDNHPVVDQAVELARRVKAKLMLVDVLPSFSWVASAVLPNADEMQRLLVDQKLQRLEKLAESARRAGVMTDFRVFTGKSSEALTREVMRGDYDLLIRTAKGAGSAHKGLYGGTAQRLLRECSCPLWLVVGQHPSKLESIAAAVNTSSNDPVDKELNLAIIDHASRLRQMYESKLNVVHAWAIWNEPLIEEHLDETDFNQFRQAAEQRVSSTFDQFISDHPELAGADGELLTGDTAEVISTFVQQNGVDLLVLGTVARSWLSGALFGNTAEKILASLGCSLLALKPAGFKSPITRE